MREYLLKRVLLIVPTLFLVSVLVLHADALRSGDGCHHIEGYAYAAERSRRCGTSWLDKPLHEQYLAWMVACCMRADIRSCGQGAHPGGVCQARLVPSTDVPDDPRLGHLRHRGRICRAVRQEPGSIISAESWPSWRWPCRTSGWPSWWWCSPPSTGAGRRCGPMCR